MIFCIEHETFVISLRRDCRAYNELQPARPSSFKWLQSDLVRIVVKAWTRNDFVTIKRLVVFLFSWMTRYNAKASMISDVVV